MAAGPGCGLVDPAMQWLGDMFRLLKGLGPRVGAGSITGYSGSDPRTACGQMRNFANRGFRCLVEQTNLQKSPPRVFNSLPGHDNILNVERHGSNWSRVGRADT